MRHINKKVIEIPIKREIESIFIESNVVLYKDKIISGDKIISEDEGITEEKNLNISDLEKIKSKKTYYLLTENDIKQIRTDPDYYPKRIPCSFDKLTQLDDYILTFYDLDYGAFCKLNGIYLPRPIYFGYDFGYIDDSRFDLESLKNYLEKFPDKFQDIQKRPYGYRYEWNLKYELSFYWIPNEKEFNEYLNLCHGISDPNRKNAIKFLDLEQFRI